MEVGGYQGAVGLPRLVVCSLNTVQPSLPGAFVCWSWEDRAAGERLVVFACH